MKRACLASNVNELDERMERVCWCVFLSWGTRESVEEGSPYAPHTFGGAFCAERRKRVPVQFMFFFSHACTAFVVVHREEENSESDRFCG